MTIRWMVTALVTALLVAPQTARAVTPQSKCLAGKTACMTKKAAALLKCEALAETPGKPADPDANNCSTKAKAAFDGGSDPAKGCFEKLEGKTPNDCRTQNDTAAAETAVDGCVASLVAIIDPPPLDQTKCGAGKKKCAAKYLAALLKCRRLSQTPGKPADPNANGCIDKAVAKYTGGDDPAKGCFAKLQAKTPNDCQSTTDSGTVKTKVESCETALTGVVAGTTTTTTIASTTTTTHASTTTTTTSSTTTTTAFLGTFCGPQNPCVRGQTCNQTAHLCEFSCGALTCTVGDQICCGDTGCCDLRTQVCNDQGNCAVPNCQVGQVYAPAQGVCCQLIATCDPGDGGLLGCCTGAERCCNANVAGDCPSGRQVCVPR
jgi:hypothetical protein